jgi:hypothetical protein
MSACCKGRHLSGFFLLNGLNLSGKPILQGQKAAQEEVLES